MRQFLFGCRFSDKAVDCEGPRTSQSQRREAGKIQEIALIAGWPELRAGGGYSQKLDGAEAPEVRMGNSPATGIAYY